MWKIKQSAGTTLVEILLYTGIVALVSVIIIDFGQIMISQNARTRVAREVDSNAQIILNQVERVIESAQTITSPVAGATGSSLTLNLNDSGRSPTSFALNGTNLQLTQGSAIPATVLNSKRLIVKDLGFTTISPSAVKISITFSSVGNLALRAFTRSYSTTFRIIK